MEYEKIKQLMEDMSNSKLTSLDIDFPDGTKVSMKKELPKECVCGDGCDCGNEPCTCSTDKNVSNNDVAVVEEKSTNVITENRKFIKSPMVGTFYLKPSPTADPYVEVGQNISIGDTVCIVEAMKLMNEIEADVAGRIVEVLVNDGEPVEYGMPLFAIE